MAELHPDNASNAARAALGYAHAFDGKGTDWQSDEPWPHRIELAQALDWIAELGAMVLNLAERVQVLALAEEGAKEAFGHVVDQKRASESECVKLRRLLDAAYADIRAKPVFPENATEPMQKAMQRAVMLRKSMNDVWHAAMSELGA